MRYDKMGWRFVRQPNGKIARYSEIVDDFTHMNMTADEAEELCVKLFDMTKYEAKRKVGFSVTDDDNIIFCSVENSEAIPKDGLNRWRHALRIIKNVHGDETFEKRSNYLEEE
jgi:hypothetical protein